MANSKKKVASVKDVEVENHGSIFSFKPLTGTAKEWIDENVASESWQWMGGSLQVDARMAAPLAQGMQEAGLVLV